MLFPPFLTIYITKQNMKRLIFILSFFAALFPFTAHAASTAPYVPLSVPTSPQAAAFKMYGDVAVNPAMGCPTYLFPCSTSIITAIGCL